MGDEQRERGSKRRKSMRCGNIKARLLVHIVYAYIYIYIYSMYILYNNYADDEDDDEKNFRCL